MISNLDIIKSVEDNVINGNWETAITTMVENPVKLVMLNLPKDDLIILGDYIIARLKS